jgi:chaperone required for assembly of F1-ATPase
MSKTTSPNRFYKAAASIQIEGGWAVHLDGRAIKTPAKATLAVPTQALANAIAAEWDAQGETLDMASMTLTKLANVAIDRTPVTRDDLAAELARYAETDVTCLLAEGPTPLREREEAAWKPWREWAGTEMGIMLIPVEGLTASPQPQASLEAVRAHALGLEDFRLTGLVWGCSLLGSAILALAVEQGALDAVEAINASCVDEDWQAEQWSQDEEAAAIRAYKDTEAAALGTWFAALN